MTIFLICMVNTFKRHTKYYSGEQIKTNEMGRACGTYGRQVSCLQGFGGETTLKTLA
jgi:hypothetical protein